MTLPLHRAYLLAAALALGLGAAPAQAFQFQDADGSTARPPQNFLDLGKTPAATDKPASNFSAGTSTLEQGNFSLQFRNQGSFNRRYDFNSQFDRYDPFGAR